MKKDITIPVVEDVWVAIVHDPIENEETEWDVYLLNMKDQEIEGVLVSSRGYSAIENDTRKTATFRHFLDAIPSKSYKKIEPISSEVFGLNNEFWVSFYMNKKMYDKKYIFLPETIKKEYFIDIPLIHKKGVLIK
ncbi:MAG: hypothetical protein ACLGGV_06405 [Bacteroidia bacterium]